MTRKSSLYWMWLPILLFPCQVTNAADGVSILGSHEADSQTLLGHMNCVGCHKSNIAPSLIKRPPNLNDVGKRITPQYLRALLQNPQHVKPGTTMPGILHGLPGGERDEAIESLVHHLVSRGGPMEQRGAGSSNFQIERGRHLYHTVGCVACHEPHDPPPKHDSNLPPGLDPEDLAELRGDEIIRPSIPHGSLAMKTTIDQLASFLQDPLKTRPSGRMPSMNLQPGEAKLLASYLLREQISRNETGWGAGLDYAYYEGHFPTMPDFESMEPKAEGSVNGFDLAAVKTPKGEKPKGNFGVRFFGAIDISEAGAYKFFSKSDDGTILKIDGKVVINNDGMHPPQEKEGTIELTAGRHLIDLGFTQGGGGYELSVNWMRPGSDKKEPIPRGLLLHGAQAMIPKGILDFKIDPVKAERGSKLFLSLGCATCHEPEKLDNQLAGGNAKSLSELNPQAEAGCLGTKVSSGRPKFAFNDKQRMRFQQAVMEVRQPSNDRSSQNVQRSFAALNCYGCHERNGKGGTDSKKAAYFTTLTTVDLGDEGRLAPALNEIGAKLTAEGFEEILVKGVRFRPHMATRMPQFGKANVGHLPAALAAIDGGKIASHKPAFSSRMVDDGRRLVGKRALGCINCHAWGPHKLQGADGMDLAAMTKRLQPSWYHAWMTDPQKLRPRTRMPTAWPNGTTFFPDIQGGDVNKQIDAIWAYLSVGMKGGMPYGLSADDQYVLTPTDEPIVFRTFMQGVGAHAIAVGFRQRTNVVFDALRVRMAQTWAGDFVSAKPAWEGRAGQYAQALGHDIVQSPPGSPFAFLASESEPWPEMEMKVKAAPLGWKFVGYRYNEDRTPTFLYRYRQISIEESPSTDYRQEGAMLVRRFKLSASNSVDDLWFRVAGSKNITAEKDGSFTIDDRIRYRIRSKDSAVIREVNDAKELLVPVRFGNDKKLEATFEVELIW